MNEVVDLMEEKMEVKSGYKKTKLGWIPSHWEEFKLVDLVDPDRKIRYGIVQPGDYDSNGRYMLRGQDYSDSKGWNSPENLFKVSDDVEQKYRKARLKKGDLILTIVGAGTGHAQEIPEWLEGANITQTTARIAIESTIANSRFYLHYLNSDLGKKQTYRFMKGGAQPGLNIRDVEVFHVAFPPLPEQQKIATILSTWDKAINTFQKLIDKKQERKKGLMQLLLTGKKRFEGFDEEWKEVKLGEIGKFLKGKGVPKIEIVEEGMPCLTYGELYKNHHNVIRKFTSFIPKELAGDSTELNYGDILFAGSGETLEEIGKSAAFVDSYPAYAGGDIIILRQSKCDPLYLGYLLNHDLIRRQLHKLGQGHSVVHIYSSGLSKVRAVLPTFEEQQKIASVLSAAGTEIEKLKIQFNKLQEQKKGLMQRLLTGDVRVKIETKSLL